MYYCSNNYKFLIMIPQACVLPPPLYSQSWTEVLTKSYKHSRGSCDRIAAPAPAVWRKASFHVTSRATTTLGFSHQMILKTHRPVPAKRNIYVFNSVQLHDRPAKILYLPSTHARRNSARRTETPNVFPSRTALWIVVITISLAESADFLKNFFCPAVFLSWPNRKEYQM